MANFENNLNQKITFLSVLLPFLLFGGFFAPKLEAQQSLPLIQKADLEYLGAFRLPRGGNGTTDGFSFGGDQLGFDPVHHSLFVGTRGSGVAEVSIPTPVKSADIETLPFATILQTIHDPLEGGLSALPESNLRGLLVVGGKLYGTASIFYDANNSAKVSTFSRSTNLSTPSATPLKALWQAEKSGYVGGWLALVPSEWQALLGGSVISGNCCMPIVSRTSVGPSAFAWNPSDFGQAVVPATPLLYYTGEHATLGPWGGANSVYGGTTVIGGMAIPEGTRSLLYFGANGTGTFCYGTGGASGGECFDPSTSSKGQHAYPYNYQVWAYDLNDLAAVKAGTKNPWDAKPYSTWQIEFPNNFVSGYGIGGVAYDSESQIIYVSQVQADVDGYSSRALIHAFKVNLGGKKVSVSVAKVNTPVEKLSYNKVNEIEPTDRRESATTTTSSTTNSYLNHRDAGRSWLGAYRWALGYGRHLYYSLLSHLKARS